MAKLPIPAAALTKHIGFLGINGSGKTSVCKSAVVEPAQALADSIDYAANGGGFNNALGRLRTLELITGKGQIKASEELFG